MWKSKKRGERRHRSYSKWMSRLKADWATHGRQYSIYPVYDWGGPDPKKIVGWRDTLCGCFNLKNKEALRFKDTPTGNESRSASKKKDGYHDERTWEGRHLEVERAEFGKPRKYRLRDRQYRRWKIQCWNCGYLIAVVRLKNDWRVFHNYLGKFYGNKYVVRCDGCKRKLREGR